MIEITNLTKKKAPNLPWEEIKNKILGKNYNLGIVLAESARMKKLNKKYRKKDKITNALSFSYSKQDGEIFLNIKSNEKAFLLLFIHSLLHLKEMEHGEKMEQEEDKYFNKFLKVL